MPQPSPSNGKFIYPLWSSGHVHVERKLECDTGYYVYPNSDENSIYSLLGNRSSCSYIRYLRVRGPSKCLSISRFRRSFFIKHIIVNHVVTAVRRCPVPSLPNGTFTKTNITFGITLEFFCNTGYTLVGATNATCTSNQTWSRSIPTCVKQGNAVTPKLTLCMQL